MPSRSFSRSRGEGHHREDGRGKVEVTPWLVDAARLPARHVDDEGHPHERLPELVTMAVHALFTEGFPMIGADDGRSLGHPVQGMSARKASTVITTTLSPSLERDGVAVGIVAHASPGPAAKAPTREAGTDQLDRRPRRAAHRCRSSGRGAEPTGCGPRLLAVDGEPAKLYLRLAGRGRGLVAPARGLGQAELLLFS